MTMNRALICVFGLLLRAGVSLWPHSGKGSPPMYGDYEAQRHWQEITVHHPLSDWYAPGIKDNDLNYWGLDYPPLTAYHSLLNGLFARDVLNKSHYVELKESHGLESPDHILFMRSTVLLADVLILIPSLLFAFKRASLVGLTLTLTYPGLILIDNGHFQYNNISLGLFVAAVGALSSSMDILGSILFVCALSYKQMELYHALPFFFYLLGDSLRNQSPFPLGSLRKLIQIGLAVLGTFALIWMPFMDNELKTLKDVLFRIFPLGRGVFEDKVSNFWCSLNLFIKIKAAYRPQELMRACALLTGLSVLPSNLHLLFRPSLRNFLASLSVTSMGFFLFSFQVHEKSILLVAFPVLLWIHLHRGGSSNAILISTWFASISVFSMTPLLIRDGLGIPTLALSILYLLIHRAFERQETVLEYTWNDFILRFTFYASLAFCSGFYIALTFIPPPVKYPDLWPVIISFYSSVHFMFFFCYFYMYQFFGSYKAENLSSIKKNV